MTGTSYQESNLRPSRDPVAEIPTVRERCASRLSICTSMAANQRSASNTLMPKSIRNLSKPRALLNQAARYHRYFTSSTRRIDVTHDSRSAFHVDSASTHQ
jgi:hypothetical protein